MGSTFDCFAGWGAITPGSEPYGYQVSIAYDSPAVAPGTAFTLNSFAREYSTGTMWPGELCLNSPLNTAIAGFPSGIASTIVACGSSGVALLSPHDLLRFTFTANAVGIFPVHMVTFADVGTMGNTYGSYSMDQDGIEQTTTYVCGGAICVPNAYSPADPTITVINPPGTGAIQGHVYGGSATPANALAGVIVHACPAVGPCGSAYTDAAGAYSVPFLANGSYVVSALAHAPFLANTIGAVAVSGGGTTGGHDIVMAGPPGAITGHVYLNASGAGNELAGALVGACPAGGGGCRTALSAGDGAYTIASLLDGPYDLTAVAPGTNVQATIGPVTVAGGVLSGQDIVVVVPTGGISGHVYANSVSPANAVVGAQVSACPAPGPGPCRVGTTDGTGAYILNYVGNGSHTVTTFPSGALRPKALTPVVVAGGARWRDG